MVERWEDMAEVINDTRNVTIPVSAINFENIFEMREEELFYFYSLFLEDDEYDEDDEGYRGGRGGYARGEANFYNYVPGFVINRIIKNYLITSSFVHF